MGGLQNRAQHVYRPCSRCALCGCGGTCVYRSLRAVYIIRVDGLGTDVVANRLTDVTTWCAGRFQEHNAAGMGQNLGCQQEGELTHLAAWHSSLAATADFISLTLQLANKRWPQL